MTRWLPGSILAMAAILGITLVVPSVVPPTDAQPTLPATDTALASETIAFFERRVAEDPWNYVIAGRLIDRYLRRFGLGANLDDISRAEKVARRIAGFSPNQPVALARLSIVLLTQHKFVEAFDVAQRAMAADSLDESALGTLFDAAMAIGRYDIAEYALARLPYRTVVRDLRAARWMSARGDDEGGSDTMRRACNAIESSSLTPQVSAWCLTELAKLEHSRFGVDSAATLFARALETQPGYRGAIEGLADLAYAREDWKKAQELYGQIAVDAHPDLYLRLAEVHAALGNAATSADFEDEFLRVAAAPGAEALFAHPLAIFYAKNATTHDMALDVILRDLERRQPVESYDVLSWVRFQRGEFAQALAASDRARRRGSPSLTMDYHRARILEALGRNTNTEY